MKALGDEWYVVIKLYELTVFDSLRFFGIALYCMESTDSMINAYLSHYVYPTIHVGAIGSLLRLGSYITPVMYIYCAVSQQYTFTLSKITLP